MNKKKMADLLDFAGKTESPEPVKINELFNLQITYLSQDGLAVDLSKKAASSVSVSVVFSKPMLKAFLRAELIQSRDYHEMLNEIAKAVEKIMAGIAMEQGKAIKSGYFED